MLPGQFRGLRVGSNVPLAKVSTTTLRVDPPITLPTSRRLRVFENLDQVGRRVQAVVLDDLGANEVAGMCKGREDGPSGSTRLLSCFGRF